MLPLAAGLLGLVVVASAIGERRRARRSDLDRVGVIDWPTVQLLALVGLAIIGILALHA